MRLGFVGELAYELHFPASRSEELWDRIMDAGREWDIRPFGLQAQRLLRLEKGHIIVSQDTDFETTPWKVGMQWAVKLDKPDFVGKAALLRGRGAHAARAARAVADGARHGARRPRARRSRSAASSPAA